MSGEKKVLVIEDDAAVECALHIAKTRKEPGRGRKPPKEGLCKRCGKTKPVNRLMLCYPCWVKTENEKKGWREGQPHPEWCGCSLDCAVDKESWGN